MGVYALYLLQSLITYVLIAAVISLIGRPITAFLNTKLKFGNTLAAVSTMVFFLIILFGLLSLFVPLILQQGENLSLLDVDALEIKITRLFEEISVYFNWDQTNWKNWFLEKDWMSTLNLDALPEFLNALLGWLSGFTIALFSIIFISFFLLKDAQLMQRAVFLLSPLKITQELRLRLKKLKISYRDISLAYFFKLLSFLSFTASFLESLESKMP